MVIIQQWLEQNYPNKSEVKKIELKYSEKDIIEGDSLIIRDYPNLEKINLHNSYLKTPLVNLNIINCSQLNKVKSYGSNLTDLDLSHCPKLIKLDLRDNNFTSIDFLVTLSNPEKLEKLKLSNNQIQPTTLDFLTKFPNLKQVLLETDKNSWEKEQKCNLFYGSLEPLKASNLNNQLNQLRLEKSNLESKLANTTQELEEANSKLLEIKRVELNKLIEETKKKLKKRTSRLFRNLIG